MIVAITGHRPEKMNLNTHKTIQEDLPILLSEVNCTYLIQGMAAGVDLWAAKAAWLSGIPFECARPWARHGTTKEFSKYYSSALTYADKITIVDPSLEYPGPWVYHKRNEYMIDNADAVLAITNGAAGGTEAAMEYARKTNKSLFVYNPDTRSMRANG